MQTSQNWRKKRQTRESITLGDEMYKSHDSRPLSNLIQLVLECLQ